MSPAALETFRAFLPVFLAAITLIGGAVVYNIQKSIDRKNTIQQERREIYRRFVVTYSEATATIVRLAPYEQTSLACSEFDKVCAELAVSAPENVTEACSQVPYLLTVFAVTCNEEAMGSRSPIAQDQYKKLYLDYLETVSEMRKDSFEETQSTKKVLSGILNGFLLSMGR